MQFSVETAGLEEGDEPPSYNEVVLHNDEVEQEPGRASTLGKGDGIKLLLCECILIIGRQLLRSVGGFFGLTAESQRGHDGEMGWQEYAERNIEVCVCVCVCV